MPPKRKGAAAKNKNEAPPAKTIKGEKKFESDKKTSTESYDDSYQKAICNLMKNIAYKDPEMYWDIIMEANFETTRWEIMNRRSEKLDDKNLDKLEALSDSKLLGKAETRFGYHFTYILILYIKKRYGDYDYRSLCSRLCSKEK